jgi:hypothetical protein
LQPARILMSGLALAWCYANISTLVKSSLTWRRNKNFLSRVCRLLRKFQLLQVIENQGIFST